MRLASLAEARRSHTGPENKGGKTSQVPKQGELSVQCSKVMEVLQIDDEVARISKSVYSEDENIDRLNMPLALAYATLKAYNLTEDGR